MRWQHEADIIYWLKENAVNRQWFLPRCCVKCLVTFYCYMFLIGVCKYMFPCDLQLVTVVDEREEKLIWPEDSDEPIQRSSHKTTTETILAGRACNLWEATNCQLSHRASSPSKNVSAGLFQRRPCKLVQNFLPGATDTSFTWGEGRFNSFCWQGHWSVAEGGEGVANTRCEVIFVLRSIHAF